MGRRTAAGLLSGGARNRLSRRRVLRCGGCMKKIGLLVVVLAVSAGCWAQVEGRPEILVLGTYHMGNPGRDVFNMQADDVLAPKRQQEMAQVIEVLKKFRPTKIA